MGARYLFFNGAKNTTAAPVKVATGTSLKTMLQVKMGATVCGEVVEWGCSFDGTAAATPGEVELIEVDVAATVTAFVAADITKYNAVALLNGDPTTALFSVGTTASGFTSTGEGSVTVVRNLAGAQQISNTSEFIQQFPLGERPLVQAAQFLRIRATFAATVNMYCYVIIEV